MKRGAEKQISKDDGAEEEEVQEPSGTEGFRKANDSVLATRQIKGIPRRSTASPASPFTPADVAKSDTDGSSAPPRFAGFAGFGAPSGGSAKPFSFTPPSASPSFTKPASSQPFVVPGSPTPTPLPPSSAFSFGSAAPKVSDKASNAAKAFASIVGGSGSGAGAPTSPVESPKPAGSNEAAVRYYTYLRGLNVSVVAHIRQAMDTNPFLDLGPVLEKYVSLRAGIQKDFDNESGVGKEETVVDSSAAASSSKKQNGAAPPTLPSPPPTSMPAAPASFAGFGGFGKPAATPTSTPQSTPSGMVTPPATFAPFGKPDAKSSSTLPTPSSSFKLDDEGSTPKSVFPAPAKPSVFGGAGSSKPSFFSLGGPSPASAFAAPASSSDEKHPASVFGGKPPSSMFSIAGDTPPIGKGAVGFGFGFGAAAPMKSEEAKTEESNTEAASGSAPPEAEGTSQESTVSTETGMSQHDVEGEGEEDEDTVASSRVKVYELRKKDKDAPQMSWQIYSVGFLRLKKHKTTSSCRLLLRNTQTGRIQINFHVYAGINMSLAKSSLTVIGRDEKSEAKSYMFRFPKEQDALEFKATIDKQLL
ncbi:unnamed protein product [Mycena citricolor]|uniref:RanBD1 domain-containing protein n=1 Tax=Mycena citricolor TaxID=2018698 RepID=A0AAD2H012_9AGAR|nr:unnamed protein product [Mycena citricolor]CAK5265578.1 unnamed protein product [Mycena citricolor]